MRHPVWGRREGQKTEDKAKDNITGRTGAQNREKYTEAFQRVGDMDITIMLQRSTQYLTKWMESFQVAKEAVRLERKPKPSLQSEEVKMRQWKEEIGKTQTRAQHSNYSRSLSLCSLYHFVGSADNSNHSVVPSHYVAGITSPTTSWLFSLGRIISPVGSRTEPYLSRRGCIQFLAYS